MRKYFKNLEKFESVEYLFMPDSVLIYNYSIDDNNLILHFISYGGHSFKAKDNKRYVLEKRYCGEYKFIAYQDFKCHDPYYEISDFNEAFNIDKNFIEKQSLKISKNFWGIKSVMISSPILNRITFKCKSIICSHLKHLNKDEIEEKKSNLYKQIDAEIAKKEKIENLKFKKLEVWYKLLENDETTNYLRRLINYFFIPFEICPTKFENNKICSNTHYMSSLSDRVPSPSLIPFIDYPSNKAMGYPDWFYFAFPDVAQWAIKGEGNNMLNLWAESLGESEIIDFEMNHIKIKYLIEIIENYRKDNVLECSIELDSIDEDDDEFYMDELPF